MKKQAFVLAMLAIVLALSATRAQAWSYNLEEFTISTDNVDSTSIAMSDNFVVWKDTMDMDFHGYDLSTREEFTISTDNVESISIAISHNYVVWKDMASMNFHGYELTGKEEFTISPNDVDPVSIFVSEDYAVWKDVMSMDFHGFDLSTRQEFIISPNDVESMSIAISGDFVVWKDITDMLFRGARIYSIANDDCVDAIEIEDDVPYDGNTIRATGTDVSSCAYNDTTDVWHFYEPNVGGQVTITTDGSNFDTTLSVFDACGGDELACNDDYSLDNTQSEVTISVVNGKTYFIRVAGFNSQTGDYQLLVTRGVCAAPIKSDLNDDCMVDMFDFAIMASEWMTSNLVP